mgnify:CR=1
FFSKDFKKFKLLFLKNKINPNKNITELIIRLILKKKWTVVIISDMTINPKKKSKKKFLFKFLVIINPLPDIEKDNNIMLTKRINNWKKNILMLLR